MIQNVTTVGVVAVAVVGVVAAAAVGVAVAVVGVVECNNKKERHDLTEKDQQ